MQSDVILSARGLTKSFRGFLAVGDVDLDVRRGTIHGLIGPNGAGKTTLFNLLTKVLKPTAGAISFLGSDITGESQDAIARRGIARAFQISSIFPSFTALENVRLGLQSAQHRMSHFLRPKSSLAAFEPRAHELLDAVGVGIRDEPASELSYGNRRALEFAMSLALDPPLLLLDEPMAGLAREDIKRITRLIGDMAANRTVLMVEHNLSVVAEICDTITVLQGGRKLAEGDYASVSRDPRVIAAYVGGAGMEATH